MNQRSTSLLYTDLEHFDNIGGIAILFISAIILANFSHFFYYFMFRTWNDSIGVTNLRGVTRPKHALVCCLCVLCRPGNIQKAQTDIFRKRLDLEETVLVSSTPDLRVTVANEADMSERLLCLAHVSKQKICNLEEFQQHWGWVGLWVVLWWAPSAKRKDNHRVSSGWSSTWFHSNTGLSSTQYEQIPIIFGVWPFWLTPFFFWSITFWRVYG